MDKQEIEGLRMRNKKLYAHIKNFVESSLGLLNEFIEKGEEIKYHLVDEVDRDGSGGSTFHTRTKPDFSGFIFQHSDDLVKLEEYQSLAKFMISEKVTKDSIAWRFPKGKIPKKIDFSKLFWFNIIISPFLNSYIGAAKGLKFNKKIFDDLYKKIEDYYYSSELSYRLFAPLYNFKSDIKLIGLGDNIRIRKITEKEINEMWESGKYGFTPFFNRDGILELYYTIERFYTKEKSDPNISPRPGDVFYNIITALRLFKKGAPCCNFISEYPDHWAPMGGVTSSSVPSPYSYSLRGPVYHLDKKESKEFQRFWGKFKQIELDKNTSLNLALRRFNFANVRAEPADRIIDYFISFEALYLHEDEMQELSYRLSLRASHFLSEDKTEREEIFNFFKKAYVLRSKIVHGVDIGETVKIGGENLPIGDFNDKIEEYLRRTLFRYIELVKHHSVREIIKTMDKKIIS